MWMIEILRDPVYTILPYFLGFSYSLLGKVMQDYYHQLYVHAGAVLGIVGHRLTRFQGPGKLPTTRDHEQKCSTSAGLGPHEDWMLRSPEIGQKQHASTTATAGSMLTAWALC